MWNPCDAAAIISFMIGVCFRFRPNTMDVGRVIYCVVSIYWYLRILNILGVYNYLGKFYLYLELDVEFNFKFIDFYFRLQVHW